jgi:hypothetical protein
MKEHLRRYGAKDYVLGLRPAKAFFFQTRGQPLSGCCPKPIPWKADPDQ